MRPILAALALSIAMIAGCSAAPPSAAPVAAPETARTPPSGPVTGFVSSYGAHVWLGLPFAAPPVGALRWRAPEPAPASTSNRTALAHGTPCLQFGSPLGGVGEPGSRQGSEDCLYLDVYAPAMAARDAQAAKLPVMVWIHGGGNTVGHAGFFDGGHLAQSQRVVVVVIQYRLGPFGWFMLPRGRDGATAASASGAERIDASGNWGTLDSIAALRWVRENVKAFGGDPTNVTVFGESAGGTNTLALLLSPLAEGLFHRAIVQSGGLGFTSVAEASNRLDSAEPGNAAGSGEILLKLLVSEGRAADAAAARTQADAMSAAEIARFLRAIAPWRFYAAYQGPGLLGPNTPALFQDGTVIRQGEPLALLADPATHIDVPTLLGTNRDEPKIFMAFDPANVVRLAGIPLWLKDAEAYDRDARYGALSWKLRGVDDIATRLASDVGNGGAPAFAYRWDWDEQGTRMGVVDLSRILGAAHGLEIPFVFGHFDIGPQSGLVFGADGADARATLSAAMMSWWANFAATGAPGRGRDGRLPEWNAWSNAERGPKMMLLDTPAGGGTRMSTEHVTRESLLRDMAAEPGDDASRCALFRRTFRFDRDAWTNAAWKSFAGGRCAAIAPAGPGQADAQE